MTIPAGKNGSRMVSITSLNGVQVYSTNIEANTTSLSIPTHNLSTGMYLLLLLKMVTLWATVKSLSDKIGLTWLS